MGKNGRSLGIFEKAVLFRKSGSVGYKTIFDFFFFERLILFTLNYVLHLQWSFPSETRNVKTYEIQCVRNN
jgi:hypothetical protein